ncbi:hypothetical protein EWM64_g7344 [Hericium alpestre]|uniref:Nicotinamide-nucleotide adenylyltransferase n=1 Tax=Hericium alpestre TaxID=135208 RepID=A0A4Y9ZQ03_9AGAM|nr:hypothetical protein EWM64_g7344 [Hericium alpestre]
MPHFALEAAIDRVKHGSSSVELIHTAHPHWPRLPTASPSPWPLRIAVLDSSFNPPTRAHLALALSPSLFADEPYDARLLLLSVRNADKQLKPGDATFAQRIEMMLLLARDMGDANVAVGILDAPTFVGKSTTLLSYLHGRLSSAADSPQDPPRKVQLTFLQGFDTLERLLAPRYYGTVENMRAALARFFSPDGDDSRVVCARRIMADVPESAEREREVLEPVKNVLSSRSIVYFDIGDIEKTFSSSEVRWKVSQADESWRAMVSPNIARYTEEQKLYGFSSQSSLRERNL